jgi:3-dehydroquinate synthase
LQHIAHGGDPFERRTGRPLDFGHWSAHRLEAISDYRIRHGEAVAIGVAIDSVYSMLQGQLSAESCEQVLTTLEALGLPITPPDLNTIDALLEGLEEFREHLGGKLTITLLNGIGKPIDVHEMDVSRIREAIEVLSQRT